MTQAEQLIRAFLLKHGHHVEAMRLLARIGIERDVLDDAQLLLEAVLELAPDYHAARFDYAQVLIERHMHQQAREQAASCSPLIPPTATTARSTRRRTWGWASMTAPSSSTGSCCGGAAAGGTAPVDRSRAQDARAIALKPSPRTARRRRPRRRLRRCLLESGESQDLPLRGGGVEQMRAAEAATATSRS